jgi:mannose-1-phosphate guanylyltransferase / mannose-6-phosphate isomerase
MPGAAPRRPPPVAGQAAPTDGTAMSPTSAPATRICPVILSGGSGTRLWPMSREAYPKQLLALTGAHSLLQETVGRVSAAERFSAPLLICNNEHRFIVAQQLREIGVTARAIVLEPMGRNTAPAVAAAAIILAAEDAQALMLVLPSDHVIEDGAAFDEAVARAAQAAADGGLVTFGITPDAPETGYGYIKRGAEIKGCAGCHSVAAFVEKPDLETARSYLADGGYAWNSGMFLFSARALLAELGRLEPEMLAGCRAAVEAAEHDLDFVRLAERPFAAIAARSLDYAVMERTERAVVVPAEIGWNDVGSWSALWDIGKRDGDGNVLSGDVVTHDVANSYIRSEGGRLVAALGIDDLIIVATDDAVLVMPKGRAQDTRRIVDLLKEAGRQEPVFHPRVYRPWGFYQGVHDGERFQVKRISVNVGAALSLQMHHHRAEHWIVVNGTARVTRNNETFLLNENESTYIPPHAVHRLENPGRVPLNLIEVQSGSYLGEDDIIRLEDVYGRD